MRHRQPSRQRLLLASLTIATAVLTVLPALPQQVRADVFMPLLMNGRERPLPAPPTAEPTATHVPTATLDPSVPTNTSRAPTRTPRPTNTPLPTDTPGPSPTATLSGGQVDHPTGSEAIVLQIGWRDEFSGYFSDVWEEMNGTPWITVYGDGRVIASKGLPNREQDLLVGQMDEYTVQRWLRALAYDAQFFSLGDTYLYPGNPKGHLLIYVRVDGGSKRVELAGWRSFERRPVPEEPNMPSTRISAVIQVIRMMEGWVNDNLSEPYTVTDYTIVIQQEKYVDVGFPLPKWPHGLNLRAVADAAPTAASNYVDRVPGHYFANETVGKEIRDIVVPEADVTWAGENRAAMFAQGGRNFVVGARQEVPGGSLFLPDGERNHWYRRDSVPILPNGAGAMPDILSRAFGSMPLPGPLAAPIHPPWRDPPDACRRPGSEPRAGPG